MEIKITGVDLAQGHTGDGSFWAVFSCKICREELGKGEGRSQEEAKKHAEEEFDPQNRNFCHICGAKLNTRSQDECLAQHRHLYAGNDGEE